jgi:hypothetical protein
MISDTKRDPKYARIKSRKPMTKILRAALPLHPRKYRPINRKAKSNQEAILKIILWFIGKIVD